MSTKTMQAIRAHDYGAPEQLKLESAPVPQPGAGEVRVRMLRAGVNPVDWKVRSGMLRAFMPVTFPWTPGLDGAGIVDAVGEGVGALAQGQAVFGMVNGGYAEYAVTGAGDLALKPDELSFDEAASVPLGVLSAWAMVEAADPQPGQRVLIHGGAGGVGLYVVQLVKARGAEVVTTTSAANAQYVGSLGADQVIDYKAQPFERVTGQVDAVLDTVGGDVIDRSWSLLRPGGILITIAGMISSEQADTHGVRAKSVSRAPSAALGAVAPLLASGALRPQVGRVFPLAQAAEAQRVSEKGHGRGRILLAIADR